MTSKMQLINIHQYATCEVLQKYDMSNNMQLTKRAKPKQLVLANIIFNIARIPLLLLHTLFTQLLHIVLPVKNHEF
jgi:hypothetical protein